MTEIDLVHKKYTVLPRSVVAFHEIGSSPTSSSSYPSDNPPSSKACSNSTEETEVAVVPQTVHCASLSLKPLPPSVANVILLLLNTLIVAATRDTNLYYSQRLTQEC